MLISCLHWNNYMIILFQIQRQEETLETYKAKDVKQDIKDFNIKLNSIECVDFGHLSYMWYILHKFCEYSIETLKTHSKYVLFSMCKLELTTCFAKCDYLVNYWMNETIHHCDELLRKGSCLSAVSFLWFQCNLHSSFGPVFELTSEYFQWP